MTIESPVRTALAPRHTQLTQAVEDLARRLDVATEIRSVAFDFEQKAFVRASSDHLVWARRNEALGAWVIGCESVARGWRSAPHRCEGYISAEAALDHGEDLWSSHARA